MRKIKVKRSKNRAIRLLGLSKAVAVCEYLKMFNLDGTPRVHVRNNGSRYIYPQALYQSDEFQQAMGLEDSKTSPREKAEAG